MISFNLVIPGMQNISFIQVKLHEIICPILNIQKCFCYTNGKQKQNCPYLSIGLTDSTTVHYL